MIDICPTITAETPEKFRKQAEQIANFATRIHIDLTDGVFAPNKLIEIDEVWWPGGVRADLHLMYKKPFEHTAAILALAPQLVIVHAEGEGDFYGFANTMHKHGIEVGVALLPKTPVKLIAPAFDYIDQVLIFSGNLGYQGGSTADLSLLSKAQEVRSKSRRIEIAWDGGISDRNAKELADGGVEVLNVGGFIQNAPNPQTAYATLESVLQQNSN
jgi:ribulose-phosphate 3-epimerase